MNTCLIETFCADFLSLQKHSSLLCQNEVKKSYKPLIINRIIEKVSVSEVKLQKKSKQTLRYDKMRCHSIIPKVPHDFL
ncbi:MAG: hypothetical protein CR997_09445 [Acidobacteria bacterium]|nr:MAG: hypothetical protein CR997_09445 [Acidobacteriota bacterium]